MISRRNFFSMMGATVASAFVKVPALELEYPPIRQWGRTGTPLYRPVIGIDFASGKSHGSLMSVNSSDGIIREWYRDEARRIWTSGDKIMTDREVYEQFG